MVNAIQDADIKLLRMFRTIAQCGGFAAAQAKLNASQSTISTQMAQLEARLGVRLCERGHGRFALTEHGQNVLKASDRLFAALEDFRSDVHEAQRQVVGELRLGLIDNTITNPECRIRDALASFSCRAPDATAYLYIGHAPELEEQVMDGRLHLAVGLFPRRVQNLQYAALFDEEHLLYCGSSHPLYEKPDAAMSTDDLANANYAGWKLSDIDTSFCRVMQMNEVASSTHMEGIAYLVMAGIALAYLPTHYASYWAEQGLMRPVLQQQTRRRVTFDVIVPNRKRLPLLTRTFLEELKPVTGRGELPEGTATVRSVRAGA